MEIVGIVVAVFENSLFCLYMRLLMLYNVYGTATSGDVVCLIFLPVLGVGGACGPGSTADSHV